MRLKLLANIELSEDAKIDEENGAEGVGLYRTEFIYMNRKDLPSEDEQLEDYARIVSAVSGPIKISTLDLGAAKRVGSGRNRGQSTNKTTDGRLVGKKRVRK